MAVICFDVRSSKPVCLTLFGDADFLKVLKSDVSDEFDILVTVLH